MVRNLPAMQGTWIQPLSWEDSPGGGHSNSLQYSCLENPQGQRSLSGYSPWGCKELDMTKHSTTQHRAEIKKDPTPSRASREEAIPCLFQRLVAAYTPWLVATHYSHICLCGHAAFSSSVCNISLCLPLMGISVIAFRAHLDNPGKFHLKTLNLIMSVKPFCYHLK